MVYILFSKCHHFNMEHYIIYSFVSELFSRILETYLHFQLFTIYCRSSNPIWIKFGMRLTYTNTHGYVSWFFQFHFFLLNTLFQHSPTKTNCRSIHPIWIECSMLPEYALLEIVSSVSVQFILGKCFNLTIFMKKYYSK